MNSPLHCFAQLSAKLQVDGDLDGIDEAENQQRLTKNDYIHFVDLLLDNDNKILDKNEEGKYLSSASC